MYRYENDDRPAGPAWACGSEGAMRIRHGGGRMHRGHGGPGGAGMGRGRRRGMRHHLAPTLLLLLKGGPRHGYALMSELGDALPRPGAAPDVSSVYRMLAELEEQGAVASRWEAGDGGGRRVYELTPQGDALLFGWIAVLEEEHRRLGRLIARYRGSPDAAPDAP